MRIRSKFILLFLALSIGPLALVGSIAYGNGKGALERSLGVLFEARASRAIEALDREVFALYGGAQSWTGLEVMEEVASDDLDGRISSFLIDQSRRNELLARALVANAEGHVVAANRPEWVGRATPMPVPEATEASQTCLDEAPTAGASGSLLTCAFAIHPGYDAGKRVGSLILSWDLDRLFARAQVDRSSEAAQGDLVLLRRDGLVVSAPPRLADWLFRRNLAASGSAAARRAGYGERGFAVEDLADQPYLVGYAHSTGVSGWSALVIQEAPVAFAPVLRLRRIVLSVGILVGLLAVVASILVSRRATGPLLEIAELAQEVAAGRLDLQVQAKSTDEIGTLARSFDTMVVRLREQRAQLVDKQYLDSILASMIDGLLVLDARGVVGRVNRAFLSLVRDSEERVVGRFADQLFGVEPDFESALLRPVEREGSVRDVELGLISKGTGQVPVHVSAGAIRNREGALEAVVCVVTDITRWKAAERALVEAREAAEDTARLKDEFIATVSHEIRTPLNGVIGMTDLLLGTPLSLQQRQYAEVAHRSGEALMAVVDDILDFEKASAGQMEVESIPFDLEALLDGVADILQIRAREKNLELVCTLSAEVAPARVLGDPARIRQVLLNLGSNAVKFTDQGTILLRIERDPGGSRRLLFSVTDTGIGIAAPDLDRLFKPFSQLDGSTTRRHGGTGLGLAICRRLVECMGGEIGVASTPGEGSRFFFTLELPEAPDADEMARTPRSALRGLHVLIVDDNATNRQVVREMLKRWGCTYGEAGDAFEALDRLRQAAAGSRPYNLAIIDFQMPEVDGGELGLEIKRDPALAGVPLLLLTSTPRSGDADYMWNLGFEAYLTKPIRPSVLHDAMAAVMGARDKPREPGAVPTRLTLVTAHTLKEGRRVRGRVLLVGEAANDPGAEGALQRAGCRYDRVKEGEEALRAMGESFYDLVLVDCHAPEVDVLEIARRIRSGERGGGHVPIVCVNAESPGERERCLGAGVDDAIQGPREPDDLLQLLLRYLPESATP